ncbi:MGSUL7 PAPS reductase [Aureobasidium sp. EXF-10728]|nr:MGSUL7 PAPS reductase [Aureobasidium sp. EXF-10728]
MPRSYSSDHDAESGYASGSSSASLPEVYFSRPHLKFINQQLQNLEPQDILKWCIMTLPRLFQTTAFGLTGLAINDMVSKLDSPIKPNIDLIYLDTLHAFKETYELVQAVKDRYPSLTIHTYKPEGCENVEDFNRKHGEKLWETNEELYDYVAKVEPAQRSYAELGVAAVITGRRRSQGGKRGDLDIVELDDAGMIKINPLANWSFQQVNDYIKENNVPVNALMSQGYRSIGDWHSTQPVKEGEDERAGRWKGRAKTECGIHNKKSRYAMFLQEQEQKRQDELSQAINSGLNIEQVV